jgi:hypothetical protein
MPLGVTSALAAMNAQEPADVHQATHALPNAHEILRLLLTS